MILLAVLLTAALGAAGHFALALAHERAERRNDRLWHQERERYLVSLIEAGGKPVHKPRRERIEEGPPQIPEGL